MADDITLAVPKTIQAQLVSANIADGRIYSHLKQGTPLPFVCVGQSLIEAEDLDRFTGTLETVHISVFSDLHHSNKLQRIMSQIKKELHKFELVVQGRDSALCWLTDTSIEHDGNRNVSRGLMRFRVASYMTN